jgi:tRNA pseudouridine38-40 synthase
MTRWKITVEYDGTNFCGWQRQAQDLSVQQVLEEAIHKFSGEDVTLSAAGRTDAGVHARAQVAHFDLARDTDAQTVQQAINFHAKPHTAVVLLAEPVADNFHARFTALNRSYRYQIINRRAPVALMAYRAWHVPRPLSIEAMQDAASLLLGRHDFSTFRAQSCQSRSPLKTLDFLTIHRIEDLVVVQAQSQSFLYHQVRNMVGTLALVGCEKWTLAQFRDAFAAKDRRAGGPTAPPHGLFFWNVTYPE